MSQPTTKPDNGSPASNTPSPTDTQILDYLESLRPQMVRVYGENVSSAGRILTLDCVDVSLRQAVIKKMGEKR